jgi:hypothetical protein
MLTSLAMLVAGLGDASIGATQHGYPSARLMGAGGAPLLLGTQNAATRGLAKAPCGAYAYYILGLSPRSARAPVLSLELEIGQ